MKRREVIALLGGASVAPFLWPPKANAQQTIPMVGFLSSGSLSGYRDLLVAFRQGLAELGFAEGKSVTIEYRWSEGHFERNPALAAELVARRPAVIVALALGRRSAYARPVRRSRWFFLPATTLSSSVSPTV